MGWLNRLKEAMSNTSGGTIGTAPSDAFATPLDLIHEALTRFQASKARDGGWVSVWIRDRSGKQVGIVQYAGDGLVNLCDRDDIDVAALLRSAGRDDLASRCEERDSAMYRVADATVEEITLVIDLILTAAFGAPDGVVIEAAIEAG
jgi:hypothetical protein